MDENFLWWYFSGHHGTNQRPPAAPALPTILTTTRRHQTLFVLGLLCGGLLALVLTKPLLHAINPSTATRITAVPATAAQTTSALIQHIGDATLDWTRSHITLPANASSVTTALHQLRVDSASTLADWMRQYPPLATRIDALIQHRNDTTPLSFHGHNGIATLLLAFKLHRATPTHADNDHGNPTTTLIIDARSLTLQAALFPRLTDARGGSLFALQDTDPNQVATHGLAVYTRSMQAARRRIPAGQASLTITPLEMAPQSTTDLVLPHTTLPEAIALPIIIVTDQ